MTTVAVLTYFKCDMCGRTWKEGKNDQALTIDVTVAAHDKNRMKGQKKAKALLCGPRCAELALAAVVYGLQVRQKTDEDRKRERPQPPIGILGFPSFLDLMRGHHQSGDEPDDKDAEGDEDDE